MSAISLQSLAETATVVDGTRVNLRSGRADTYRVIKSLEPGTRLQVLREGGGYMQVKTDTGEVGWLPTRMLNIEQNTPKETEPDPRLAALQAELDQARAALAERPSPRAGESKHWPPLLVGLGALVLGICLGMGGLRAYYLKRLKGLRI